MFLIMYQIQRVWMQSVWKIILFTVRDKSWIANDVITDDRVREIVKEAIKIYDADKTGRVDYALESAGEFVEFNRSIRPNIVLTG